MEWWGELSADNKVTVISAVISAVLTSLIVLIGFVVTYYTSISASKKISGVSSDLNKTQLVSAQNQKLAEMRLVWIEDLRNSAADLYRDQYALSLLNRDYNSKTRKTAEERAALKNKRRELFLSIARTKRDINLRFNPETTQPDELELRKLLGRSVSDDAERALMQRKQIESVIGRILQAEWRRVKEALEVSS